MRALKSAAPFYRRKARPVASVPASTTRVKTAIGEMGIHEANGREVILRPSLYAMSQLGEPDEIVKLLANVCDDPVTPEEARLQHMNAIAVLAACTPQDIRHLTGHHDGVTVVPGRIPRAVLMLLARRLLRHGVTGTLPEQEREAGSPEPEYTREFDTRSFVAMGMAHLGLSEDDAWNMTMTGLVGAMRSKYPPVKDMTKPGASAPSKKELLEALAWHDKIQKIRAAKNA